jgi:hypothetical protein
MVATTPVPAIELSAIQSTLTDSPAVTDSIAAYIASGERVRALMDLAWKVGLGLVVLVVLAWAAGVLPAAVKLF